MTKKFKKILTVLAAVCVSACAFSLVACDNGSSNSVDTSKLPTPTKPEESSGAGGGSGMGQQPTGDEVAEADVPTYDASEVVTITTVGEVYDVTFTDAFAVEWTADAAGSYMLAVYDQNAADQADHRNLELYVKQNDTWKKFTVNPMGPIGVGLNPTEAGESIIVVVKAPDTADSTTFNYITLTVNGQGGGPMG